MLWGLPTNSAIELFFLGANSIESSNTKTSWSKKWKLVGPFNHDNTITITFKTDDCRSVAGGLTGKVVTMPVKESA